MNKKSIHNNDLEHILHSPEIIGLNAKDFDIRIKECSIYNGPNIIASPDILFYSTRNKHLIIFEYKTTYGDAQLIKAQQQCNKTNEILLNKISELKNIQIDKIIGYEKYNYRGVK